MRNVWQRLVQELLQDSYQIRLFEIHKIDRPKERKLVEEYKSKHSNRPKRRKE